MTSFPLHQWYLISIITIHFIIMIMMKWIKGLILREQIMNILSIVLSFKILKYSIMEKKQTYIIKMDGETYLFKQLDRLPIINSETE